MVSDRELQRVFKNAVRRAYYETYTPARLGRPDGGGSYLRRSGGAA
jgi:transcriptional regulator GlxA family with amidase domain